MRHRVKLRPSIFADGMKPSYADGYAVYCDACKAPAHAKWFEHESEAIRKAAALAQDDLRRDHRFSVYPVVDGHLITSVENTMVVWQPTISGTTLKYAMTLHEYNTMFERVEE